MQILEDNIEADSLYLLDEPEVSLYPQNQVKLAEEINKMSRYHELSTFVGTVHGFSLKILNYESFTIA